MNDEPVGLTRTERRLVGGVLIVSAVGETALRVLGNTTGVWWPAFTLAAGMLVFVATFIVWIARSRHRSVRSVLALGVPERLRRP